MQNSKLDMYLGAGWGTNLAVGNSRQLWKKSWEKIFQDPLCYADRENGYGADQDILTK